MQFSAVSAVSAVLLLRSPERKRHPVTGLRSLLPKEVLRVLSVPSAISASAVPEDPPATHARSSLADALLRARTSGHAYRPVDQKVGLDTIAQTTDRRIVMLTRPSIRRRRWRLSMAAVSDCCSNRAGADTRSPILAPAAAFGARTGSLFGDSGPGPDRGREMPNHGRLRGTPGCVVPWRTRWQRCSTRQLAPSSE